MHVRFREPNAALSERACKVFQVAHQEAHRLNHSAVGLEHLLLGLAKEAQSPAALTLARLGFDLGWLRERVAKVSPPVRPARPTPGVLPYRDDLVSFLRTVTEAGEGSGLLPLTPEHLLAALVDDADCLPTRLLRQRRFALWRLRRRLRRMTLRLFFGEA